MRSVFSPSLLACAAGRRYPNPGLLGLTLVLPGMLARCFLGREYDNCVRTEDCADGEVCYNNRGIHVCVPESAVPGFDALLDGDEVDAADAGDSGVDARPT